MTINTAEWQTESLYNGGTAGAAYPEHDAYLVLDVTITGVKGRVTTDSTFWKAYGADGTEFGKAASSNFKPDLPYANLTAGQSARGYVVLDAQRGPVTVVWSGLVQNNNVLPGPSTVDNLDDGTRAVTVMTVSV